MQVIVGDTGVLIPRRVLRGVKAVDIRKERRNIVVEPSAPGADPIFDLGKNPVHSAVNDGAEHHDAQRIKAALAFDEHFIQAGFERLQ